MWQHSVLLGCWSLASSRYLWLTGTHRRLSFKRDFPDKIHSSNQTSMLDAASVIQTEVNLIRSREIAEGVVTRLGLAKDPNFAEHSSLLNRALALITFWHSRPSFSNSSVNSLIAARLLKNLDVTNDPKSLLIRISYTSTSPEQSARIANAFAEEYLRTRRRESGSAATCRSCCHLRPEAP